MAKQERCVCQAPLRDGKCPHRCEEFAQPSWRQARMEAKLRKREADESSVRRYLSGDESKAGILRAVPTYRRDFFERSVRVRARSSRNTRSVD